MESKYEKLIKYIRDNIKETKQIEKDKCIYILSQKHSIICIGAEVWEILIDNEVGENSESIKSFFTPVTLHQDVKENFLGTINNSIVLFDTSLEQQSFIVDNTKFYWKEKM